MGHGIRVEGYNLSKSGNGVKITVAHGNWKSKAHNRYGRYRKNMRQVHAIPTNMLNARESRWTADIDDEDDSDESSGVRWSTTDSEAEGAEAPEAPAAVAVRDAVTPPRRLTREDLTGDAGPGAGRAGPSVGRAFPQPARESESLVPPGWAAVRRSAAALSAEVSTAATLTPGVALHGHARRVGLPSRRSGAAGRRRIRIRPMKCLHYIDFVDFRRLRAFRPRRQTSPQVHLRAQDPHISPCTDLAQSLGLLGRV